MKEINQDSKKGIYFLPNLVTTAAIFSGFYAIVSAMNSKFEIACIAVFVAMILDGLDGRVARWTNTESEFGEQYDSLADLISFGMAPALVMFQWALVYMRDVSPSWGKLGWMAAFIYVACAALRLARFNTQIAKADNRFFSGLPSPSAAAIMVSMIWMLSDLDVLGKNIQIPAVLLTISAGLLMVSTIPYYSFKSFDFRNKVPLIAILIVILIFALVAIDPPKVLFTVFLAYVLSGPLVWIKNIQEGHSLNPFDETTAEESEIKAKQKDGVDSTIIEQKKNTNEFDDEFVEEQKKLKH